MTTLALLIVLMLTGVGSIGRGLAGKADERDALIESRAFSMVGRYALPMTADVTIAYAFGAPVLVVLATLMWAQLLMLVALFVYYHRTI